MEVEAGLGAGAMVRQEGRREGRVWEGRQTQVQEDTSVREEQRLGWGTTAARVRAAGWKQARVAGCCCCWQHSVRWLPHAPPPATSHPLCSPPHSAVPPLTSESRPYMLNGWVSMREWAKRGRLGSSLDSLQAAQAGRGASRER